MTFPQTSPVDATRNGQEFWRLFTRLESSGDIYESNVSGLGFALGPSSDVSKVEITYFDVNAPGRASTVEISNDKPFIGRLDAFASLQYGTGQRGRLLISPTEYIPQAGVYEPQGFQFGDTITIENIYIDLFQYLAQEPGDSAVPQRTDRTYFYQAPRFGAVTGRFWIVVPYYGRRYASILFNNASAVSHTITVYGVNLDTGTSLAATNDHPQILLRGPTSITNDITNMQLTASADGMYNLLVILVATAFPTSLFSQNIPLKIVTSDKEG